MDGRKQAVLGILGHNDAGDDVLHSVDAAFDAKIALRALREVKRTHLLEKVEQRSSLLCS